MYVYAKMASTTAHQDVVDKETAADPGKHPAVAGSSLSRDYGIESSSEDSLDDNYQVFKATAEAEADFDAAERKKVLRKIDLRVVPVLFVTYFLQYL